MNKVQAPIAGLSPVLSGKVCPYCNSSTEYVDSAAVYDKSYGMIYLCRPCNAWVGLHEGTDQALGRLANAELRELKMLAHRWFDPIAVEGLINEFCHVYVPGLSTRAKAYYWLASEMGIKAEFCHIVCLTKMNANKLLRFVNPSCKGLKTQVISGNVHYQAAINFGTPS